MRRYTLTFVLLLSACVTSPVESGSGPFAEGQDAGVDGSPDGVPDATPDVAPAPQPAPAAACVVRCARGVVKGRDGAPAVDIPVLLENRWTQQIRSYLTGSDGSYRFNGLSAEVEYELSARAPDGSRARASVDRFDERSEIVIDLALR